MQHTDLEIDLVFNNLTDDILKELEALGQLPPNQYWLTPDASSDNTITDNISELNTLIKELTVAHNATKTDLAALTSNYNNHNHDSIYLNTSGDTLTGPLKVTGGDATTVGKLILDETNRGQITNTSTATLLGFNNSTQLTVGAPSYAILLRGSATRPTYNGNNMALYSDIPTDYATSSHTHSYLPTIGGTLTGHTYFKGGSSNSSTSNTAQIVMQRSDGTQQWALTSNDNMFIVNPSTTSTTGQLVCNLGSKLYMSGADLGTSSYKWNNVYISGTLYIG